MSLKELRAFLARHGAEAAGADGGPAGGAVDWRVVFAREWHAPDPSLGEDRGRLARGFTVSLAAGAMLSRGQILQWLVRGGMASYARFYTLQGVAVASAAPPSLPQPAPAAARPGGDDASETPAAEPAPAPPAAAGPVDGPWWCRRVPGGRADVVTDPSVSLGDKRSLGRLFASLIDAAHAGGGGDAGTHNESMLAAGRALYRPQAKAAAAGPGAAPGSVAAVLKSDDGSDPAAEWLCRKHPAGAGLSRETAATLLLGVAGAASDADIGPGADASLWAEGGALSPLLPPAPMPAALAARRLSEYSFSVGRHAAGVAHVVCEYGSGEACQVFSRGAAVNGAIFVLREPAAEAEPDAEAGPEGVAEPAGAAEAGGGSGGATEAGDEEGAGAARGGPSLPPVRFRVKTSHGVARSRVVVSSPGHAAPPAGWASGAAAAGGGAAAGVLVVADAVAFVECGSSPLPLPRRGSDAADASSRVCVVVPPGTVRLGPGSGGPPGGSAFPYAVRVTLGGASDSVAPQTGRHWQLRATAAGRVAGGPGTLGRAAEAVGVLCSGAEAALRWLVSSRGGSVLFGAAWGRAVPSAAAYGGWGGGVVVTAAADGTSEWGVMVGGMEEEAAAAVAAWAELRSRMGADVVPETMFEKEAPAEPDAEPEDGPGADAAAAGGEDGGDDAAAPEVDGGEEDDDGFDAADLASLLE